MNDKIHFCVFCIENVARALGKTGTQMYDELEKSGLIENYILAHFDALHTQSKEYIVNDIIEALNQKAAV